MDEVRRDATKHILGQGQVGANAAVGLFAAGQADPKTNAIPKPALPEQAKPDISPKPSQVRASGGQPNVPGITVGASRFALPF